MAINELSPKQIENAKPQDTDYGNAVNLLMTILICSHSILVTSG